MLEVQGRACARALSCFKRLSKSISNGVIFPSQSDRKSADISQADAFACTSLVQL